jgi:hypothetical protein
MANFNDIVQQLNLATASCGPLSIVKNDPENSHSFPLRGAIFETATGQLVAPPIPVPHTVNITEAGIDSFLEDILHKIINISWQLDAITYRLYHYQGQWNLSTNGLIDPAARGWGKGPSFLQIFQEATASSPIDMASLDNAYCYCYHVQHPSHYEVAPPATAGYRLFAQLPVREGLPPIYPESEFSKMELKERLQTLLQIEDPAGMQGYRILLNDGNILRINSPAVNFALYLRGNTSNVQWRMCELVSRSKCSDAWLSHILVLGKMPLDQHELYSIILNHGLVQVEYYVKVFPAQKDEYSRMSAAMGHLKNSIMSGLRGQRISSRHVKIMRTMQRLVPTWNDSSVLAYLFTLEPQHLYYLLDFNAGARQEEEVADVADSMMGLHVSA